jgi:hypothetical protein
MSFSAFVLLAVFAGFLLRLWLVASVCWIAFIAWMHHELGGELSTYLWFGGIPIAVVGGIVWAAGGLDD